MPGRGDRRLAGRRLVGLAAGLAALTVVAVWSTRSAWGRETAARLQRQVVQAREFGSSGDMARVLKRLARVHSLPSESDRRREARFGLRPIPPSELSTTLQVPQEWIDRGVPVMALVIDPEALAELDANPRGHGREWERRAYVGYLEDGALAFGTGVGLRFHGGYRREQRETRSYRLHFRNRYGMDRFPLRQLPPALFPSRRDAPPRVVVLLKDSDADPRTTDARWINALAYDVSRRLGLITPEVSPVALFLNGRLEGLFTLGEYHDEEFLDSRLGHHDFLVVQTKQNQNAPFAPVKRGDPALYAAFRAWARREAPIDFAEASRVVDLENLVRWHFAIVYCGTQDPFQGTLVLDLTDPAARWRWLTWDMDVSFGLPGREWQNGWRQDSFNRYAFGQRRWDDPRYWLVRRLLAGDERFRRLYLRTVAESLDHRLTPGFFAERIEHYRRISERYGMRNAEGAAQLTDYAQHRPDALRAQLSEHLGIALPHPLEVDAPADCPLEVDGHPVAVPWTGHYWPQVEALVRAPTCPDRPWTLDGDGELRPDPDHPGAVRVTVRGPVRLVLGN